MRWIFVGGIILPIIQPMPRVSTSKCRHCWSYRTHFYRRLISMWLGSLVPRPSPVISRLFSLTKFAGTGDYLTKRCFLPVFSVIFLRGLCMYYALSCGFLPFNIHISIRPPQMQQLLEHPPNTLICTDTSPLTFSSSLLNFSDCFLGEETFLLAFSPSLCFISFVS